MCAKKKNSDNHVQALDSTYVQHITVRCSLTDVDKRAMAKYFTIRAREYLEQAQGLYGQNIAAKLSPIIDVLGCIPGRTGQLDDTESPICAAITDLGVALKHETNPGQVKTLSETINTLKEIQHELQNMAI